MGDLVVIPNPNLFANVIANGAVRLVRTMLMNVVMAIHCVIMGERASTQKEVITVNVLRDGLAVHARVMSMSAKR